DQRGHALAVLELAADQVARALGGDHGDVDAGRGLDVAEPDVEAVREEQRVAVLEVGLDGLGVQRPLHVVGDQDHDQVGLGGRLGGRDDPQALGLGLGAARAALGQADADVDPGVAQRQRVGVALTAVAQDGDGAPLDDRQVGVVVVEDLGGHAVVLSFSCSRMKRGQAERSTGRKVPAPDIDLGPRPRATVPDCAISLIPSGARTASSACSLSGVPVASRVTVSVLTSTTWARKSSAVWSTCVRSASGARTFTSSSSRWTAAPSSSSTILITSISLLSCLVICSSGADSASATIVMRDRSGFSVGPTARDSMLKPRRLNSAETRARTPALFSTRTESVWRVIVSPQTWSAPKTGRTSRAAMMSSLLDPAATIGQTWASCPTTKSITTGASSIAMAFSITASTSSLVSHRRPTQPIASASSAKSGMRTGLGVPSSLRACSRVLEY